MTLRFNKANKFQQLLQDSGYTFSLKDLNASLQDLSFISKFEEINVVFLSSKKIKGLNQKFRGKNEVTDVLAFNIDKQRSIGDIYICIEYIQKFQKNAAEIVDEIIRLIIHGMLHLAGYEHKGYLKESSNQEEEMFIKQERILNKVLEKVVK